MAPTALGGLFRAHLLQHQGSLARFEHVQEGLLPRQVDLREDPSLVGGMDLQEMGQGRLGPGPFEELSDPGHELPLAA